MDTHFHMDKLKVCVVHKDLHDMLFPPYSNPSGRGMVLEKAKTFKTQHLKIALEVHWASLHFHYDKGVGTIRLHILFTILVKSRTHYTPAVPHKDIKIWARHGKLIHKHGTPCIPIMAGIRSLPHHVDISIF